ncbi:hypothetical protein L9F63_002934, partial [Diploptera punctata]
HNAVTSSIFTTENSTVITAQTASTTTLPCGVRKFGNGVVKAFFIKLSMTFSKAVRWKLAMGSSRHSGERILL